MFDKDGNGYISLDELKSAMEIMDESITDQQLTEIFRMADSDRDGKICYEGKDPHWIVLARYKNLSYQIISFRFHENVAVKGAESEHFIQILWFMIENKTFW